MKVRSITLLLIAALAAMSLWFVAAAILPEMSRETAMSPARQAALSSGVQGGFVVGALLSAWLGLPDRMNPRLLFSVCAVAAGLCNALLVVATPGSGLSIAARIATGMLLAGVYPVGLKIAVGWGQKDRAFLVGLLIGALTLGTALSHVLALAGGTDWRFTVLAASAASCMAGIIILGARLGPYHVEAPAFDPRVIGTAWRNRRVRLAYAGYLGHMWEIYAMWAWIAAATAVSYGMSMPVLDAERLAKITAFTAIAAGGFVSVIAGFIGDRIGKAETAAMAMAVSGASAILVAATLGGPAWLTFALVLLWGISVVPDSAQFSALVADAAPPDQAGSLMTFQTALGFALTFVTVQIAPGLAVAWGWPVVLAGLALGPAIGIMAMLRLRTLQRSEVS